MIAKKLSPQTWLIFDDKKIGQINLINGHYEVTIGKSTTVHHSLTNLNFKFEDPPAPQPQTLHDVKLGLTLFKKSDNSKALHAVGWYKFKKRGEWVVEEHPRHVLLSRNQFVGPFCSEREAHLAPTV